MAVSGLSWIMPNGTVAPGKVWPSPPVPIMGSTATQPALAAGVAAWDADRPPSHVVAMSSSAAPQAVRSGDGETDDMDAPLGWPRSALKLTRGVRADTLCCMMRSGLGAWTARTVEGTAARLPLPGLSNTHHAATTRTRQP